MSTSKLWAAPPPVVLQRRVSGATAVVVLSGELDLASADVLHRVLAGAPTPAVPNLAVDVRRVRFMDCRGVRPFVAAYEESRRCGGCLRVVGAAPEPFMLLRATGLTALFCLHPTMRSATARGCPRHSVRRRA